MINHIALTLFACQQLLASSDSLSVGVRADTDTVYRYGEVVISAERYPVSARNAGSVSYLAPRTDEWQFEGPGAAVALMRNLHLSGYGGGMALQTLSIRGMASEHTLVLWNGLPAGNMQTGVADFNLFNAADLDAIAVVPGGASALYGSGAVGGVVNLVPRFPYATPSGVEVGARTGSFAESRLTARVTLRPDTALGISVRAGRSRSRNNFTFADPGGESAVIRRNEDYLSQSVSLSTGWEHGKATKVGAMVTAIAVDQGAPGPWSPATPQSSARRNDVRYVAAVSGEMAFSPRLVVTTTGIYDRQYERYLDRDGPYPADNFYRTSGAGVSGQVRYQASPVWLFQAGTDLSHAWAGGNAIAGTRSRSGAALSGAVSLVMRAGDILSATVTPAVRWEGNGAFASGVSPKLGLNLEREREEYSLRVHGSAGTGHRDPTMNELYYSGEGGRGNPAIKSESSVSFDGGVGGWIGAPGGGIVWDATLYQIRMDDRIQWLPTSNPRIWTPQNLGRTRSSGWEFGFEWKMIPGEFEIHGDYSIINSRKASITPYGSIEYRNQLIYVPLDKGSLGLLVGKDGINAWLRSLVLRLDAIHTGERFIVDDQSLSLPGHRIATGSLLAKLSIPYGAVVVNYTVENLTNVSFRVMPGYPMPGRSHSISLYYSTTF